jgi:biopolymer transport protein ExbD
VRFRAARRSEPSINLTPLIDILFTVLMFLVLTTTFHESTQLQVELPEASTGAELPRVLGGVRVMVSRDGQLYVADQAVTLSALGRMLESVSHRDDAQLLLAADEGAAHGRVVEVMDLARRTGVFRLGIETLRIDPPQD